MSGDVDVQRLKVIQKRAQVVGKCDVRDGAVLGTACVLHM
jgi:hypothetical protein